MSYNLTGQRFGYLLVVDQAPSDPKRKERRWVCRCECGNHTVVPSYRLRHGGTLSCGCHKYDRSFCSKKAKNNPRLYGVYKSIQTRCHNPKNSNYYLYGGRGIDLCDEWKEFDTFCDWALANGYDENAQFGECTIDRIDPDKGYSPDNCRWVNMTRQNNNRRNNHLISFNGETKTIAEWERHLGLYSGAIYERLKSGWSIEHALTVQRLRGSGHYYRKTYGESTQRTS